MENLNTRNQKIINAVIEKANKVCPDSLALIGICGSFATGDFYEKSDLDLLVLINDDMGWQLSGTFIQDDLEVGHDIYCTTWDDLREASLYGDPNIAKLMDSKIVYCADEKYMKELLSLRQKAKDILSAPFSEEDYIKAEKMLQKAEHFYFEAMAAEDRANIRVQAGYALYYIENAVALLNKRYFKYGTKRAYEELTQMKKRPRKITEMIESVAAGETAREVRLALTALIRETKRVFEKAKKSLPVHKRPASKDSLSGTYEEMFSNWRNKMYLAAETGNRHLAYMSMISLSAMLEEINGETDIAQYRVFDGYDPRDLQKTALAFDRFLEKYLEEYKKVGLRPERYKNIDEFAEQYRKIL